MFRNFFLSTVRNLTKKKSFSLLNIAGLAIGITCAALIFLWVEDELNYNHYFKNRDNLYQVMTNQTYDAETFTFGSTPGLLGPALPKDMPGILSSAQGYLGTKKSINQRRKIRLCRWHNGRLELFQNVWLRIYLWKCIETI